MLRRALLAVVLSGTLGASAAVQVGQRIAVGEGSRSPLLRDIRQLHTVATSWGALAVWDGAGGIRAVRVNRDGELLDDPPIAVSPHTAIFAAPATDGTDVLVTFAGASPSGATTFEIVRITPDGGVQPFFTLPRRLAAILWTGNQYAALLGECTIDEGLQLDRSGAVTRSVRLRLPRRQCDDPSRITYRDPNGVVHLVVQNYLLESTDDYDVRRVALTDANGDLLAASFTDGKGDPFDSAVRLHAASDRVLSTGATPRGFHLLTRTSLDFFDHAGRLVTRIPHGANDAAATTVGDEVLVAQFAFPGGGALTAWRMQAGGRRRPMGVGPVSERLKRNASIVALPRGAAVFWLEQDLSFRGVAPMMTRVSRGPFARRNLPVALEQVAAQQYDVAAAAHANGMLAVWSQFGVLGAEVFSALLESSGHAGGTPVRLMPGERPLIASSGEVALVVARQRTGTFAMRVDRHGTPLDRDPVRLPLDAIRVLWDGSAFVVLAEGGRALRIDENGLFLTLEPVNLTAATVLRPSTLAVGPDGALFVFVGLRVPGDFSTRAVFAQRLTRDLRPDGQPELVSILDPGRNLVAIRDGDHYRIAFDHGGDSIRVARVARDGKPLDDVFPSHAGEYWGGPLELAIVGGQLVVVSRDLLPPSEGGPISSVVRTRDGRTWFFYTDRFHAFARELSPL